MKWPKSIKIINFTSNQTIANKKATPMKYCKLVKFQTFKNITFCKHLVILKDPAIPFLDTP